MRSLILTAAALLATVSVARADPTLVRRWNAPPVIVDQVQLDNGNQFCGLRIGAPTTSAWFALYADIEDGRVAMFGMPGHAWTNEQPSLQFDDRPAIAVTMHPLAEEPDTFAANIEADGGFMHDLRSSRTLTVQAGDISVRFSLEGVATAATAWESCYAVVRAQAPAPRSLGRSPIALRRA